MRPFISSALLLSGIAAAQAADSWSDTKLARTEALAILQTLNAELLSRDSATLTLDKWCESHKLAGPSSIIAERVRGAENPATPETRALLRAGAEEKISYRRVRLSCGGHVLSEADNWYVASRLTADMNRQLESSDISFGRVVQPLGFRRQTLSAKLLWEPLPPGWEMPGAALNTDDGAPLQMPSHVLEHRAILLLPDGTPFSALVESYTKAIFDFRR